LAAVVRRATPGKWTTPDGIVYRCSDRYKTIEPPDAIPDVLRDLPGAFGVAAVPFLDAGPGWLVLLVRLSTGASAGFATSGST
jgi:hypothetical protein